MMKLKQTAEPARFPELPPFEPPDWGPLDWRAPIVDHRLVNVDFHTIDDLLSVAGDLLRTFGIEIHIAEYHGDVEGVDYLYKFRREDGEFGPPWPISRDRLRGELYGMFHGAAHVRKEKSETIKWRSHDDWLKTWSGLEVQVADCPENIARCAGQNHEETGPRRWHLVQVLGQWAPGPMNDLQLEAFIKGIQVAVLSPGFKGRRESQRAKPKRRLRRKA